MLEKGHIQIPKSVLAQGANEVFIYSILSKGSLVEGSTFIYLPQITEVFGTSNRTENRTKIKEILANLEESVGLQFFNDFQLQKSTCLTEVNFSKHFYAMLPSVKENFIKVYLEDLNRFYGLNNKESKHMMMFQYLYIIGMVNESGRDRKISYPTIEQIVQATGFDRKTVFKYNELLKKYEFIYYETITINDKSKNIYSRWSDQKDVIDAALEARTTGKISKTRNDLTKNTTENEVKSETAVLRSNTKEKTSTINLDPSILSVLKGFTDAGLTLHKGTVQKVEEAVKICGKDQILIVIKEMEYLCENNMVQSKWAGFFSNNIVSKANERKNKVEAQKNADKKLEKISVPADDYYNDENYRKIHERNKALEKERRERELDNFFGNPKKEEKQKDLPELFLLN